VRDETLLRANAKDLIRPAAQQRGGCNITHPRHRWAQKSGLNNTAAHPTVGH